MAGRLGGARVAWRRSAVLGSPAKRAAAVAGWAVGKAVELPTDRYYRARGLDTRGPAFGPDPRDGLLGYVPSDWRVLRQMFPKGSVTPDDVVLEYGSGKGRVVIWLVDRFAIRGVGVELDPNLVRDAEANLRTWRGGDLSDRVTMVCADARAFDVPDDVTLVYLFNPFLGEVFDAVLARLQQSLERRPRELRIAYLYPIMHDSLVGAGFQLESSRRHVFRAWAWYRRPLPA